MQTISEIPLLHNIGLDCFDIVESCELLTGVLLESSDPEECRSARICLSQCLSALEVLFEQPLSASRIKQLTTTKIPEQRGIYFYQESQLLRQYCQALNQMLMQESANPAAAKALTGLLFDLTDYMACDLRAPRFASGQTLH